jgi:hypothetical protein
MLEIFVFTSVVATCVFDMDTIQKPKGFSIIVVQRIGVVQGYISYEVALVGRNIAVM